MDIGLGLWTMRAPAAAPAAPAAMYRALRQDALLAEDLGYHSLWIAEHHFWYDGWTPSPLTAAASVLAATTTLHVGTGVNLVALQEPERICAQVAWLDRLSGGRFEHGVGLGYRAAEYDGFGLSRRVRGKRMDASLASLGQLRPRVWVGGFARPAIERAIRHGAGLLLPSTLDDQQLGEAIAFARSLAADQEQQVPIGLMKYTWPTDGTSRGRRQAEAILEQWTREYAGAWFPLRGRPGFDSPELLDAQMLRSARTALIGHPDELGEQITRLRELGVELLVLHLLGDGRRDDRHQAMEALTPAISLGKGS